MSVLSRLLPAEQGSDGDGLLGGGLLDGGPFLDRGGYRAVLETFDTRIGVTGTRGKSSMTRWLHDAFHDRGYGAAAKITGNHPKTVVDGAVDTIRRKGPQVRLYENERILRRAASEVDSGPSDPAVAICENHGLREYTMRVFNERFLRPDIVVLTNIRQDHLDTLGESRQEIARSFARSIPSGTHVISGERQPILEEYLETQVEKRGATIEHVDVPEQDRDRVGAEMVYLLDAVLAHVDSDGLPPSEREGLLGEIRPVWQELPRGHRVANAAPANDVESTEMVRRDLAGNPPDTETVCPFVFLRDDRRGRTASFLEYADILYERDLIREVHVAGEGSRAFVDHVEPPATRHDADPDRAPGVLDELLATDDPVIYMANAVDPFMRALITETEIRAASTTPTQRDPGRESWAEQDDESWSPVEDSQEQ